FHPRLGLPSVPGAPVRRVIMRTSESAPICASSFFRPLTSDYLLPRSRQRKRLQNNISSEVKPNLQLEIGLVHRRNRSLQRADRRLAPVAGKSLIRFSL